MTIKITYFVHGTTLDNEEDLTTGWQQGKLSKLGREQAKKLGILVKDRTFDVIFCSDLKRAVDSANLGFKGKYKIIQDKRLRECNYGDLNGVNGKEINYLEHIEVSFPNGECLRDVEERIGDFLEFLRENYDNKEIAIIAHKASQLALEVLTKGKSWKEAIKEDWRNTKDWQAGWEYIVE